MQPRYIVITPARNEEQNIVHTISSMAAQTLPPYRWVIVDDGSTDATARLIDAAALEHPWIRVLHRSDRGFRKQGGGVIDAFYDGYHTIDAEPWDYLAKFDADLSFERDYFARCLAVFAAEPTLGIGGGTICRPVDQALTIECRRDPAFHVRGATKIYRRACWEAIGGLIHQPGWDTVDELKANMLGWTTRTFPGLLVHHHRPTGSADGMWRDGVKCGISNFVAGYHPLFMAAKCLRHIAKAPNSAWGFGLVWGFFQGYVHRMPRVPDSQLIRYVRKQQIRRLCLRPGLWSDLRSCGSTGDSSDRNDAPARTAHYS